MGTSVWDRGLKTHFEPLKVDFKIPEDLQEEINDLLYNLNYEDGNFADCYEDEIRSSLNGYLSSCEIGCIDGNMTEEHISILREYYCLGGIYDEDAKL